MKLSKYVWFNGKFILAEKARVPVTTHAIQYGTSAFEGIRGYWNGENLNIFRLDEHLKRFRRSGQYYDMELQYSDQQMASAIINTCKKNKIVESCYIRPFYFVGDNGISLHVTGKSPINVVITVMLLGDLFDKRGITTAVSSWRKFSDSSAPTQAKMGGNYLNSVIATQEAKRNGVDEAILLDHNGNVSEASGENIFVVSDTQMITPTLASSALQGITKDAVTKIAKDLDIDMVERDISRSELGIADEIFLTGTAAEIVPVISVDGLTINNGKVGSVTKRLMDIYTEIVMGKNDDYAHWLTQVY